MARRYRRPSTRGEFVTYHHHKDNSLISPQSVDAGRSLVRSQDLRDAGIYYLEHESFQFATEAGREWKVYGSPVCSNQFLVIRNIINARPQAAPYYARGSFQYMTYKEAEGEFYSLMKG
jgi:hypothetical protein